MKLNRALKINRSIKIFINFQTSGKNAIFLFLNVIKIYIFTLYYRRSRVYYKRTYINLTLKWPTRSWLEEQRRNDKTELHFYEYILER